MKPRITLAETTLPDGSPLALQEHDGRHYLVIHGQQLAGPATQAVDAELARLACAPFRPARQPKIMVVGLGLGHALAAATAALPQKRATFLVVEPLEVLADWHRAHVADTPLADDRVRLRADAGPGIFAGHAAALHAIIVQRDACPLNDRRQPWTDDPRWLAQAYEALQTGGLLAIAASRPAREVTRRLQRAGFTVAEHQVPASPLAKKSRLAAIWLARKGKYGG
jgi:spermidine synthase